FTVQSRVRVVAVVIRAGYGRYERRRLLKWLNATGTVIEFDPRWTLPWRRMKLFAQTLKVGMTAACDSLLGEALDQLGVSRDPAVLLGLEEKKGE
ncbi:unnamed protein product, partial [marine sediment metagenome]